MKLRINGNNYMMWCPGCDELHMINDNWSFNGNVESPTFSPSILTWLDPNPDVDPKYDPTGKYRSGSRCHSFLVDGVWQFLTDCTHALAGQNVPMVELPDYFSD
jgi:hypothetical protein